MEAVEVGITSARRCTAEKQLFQEPDKDLVERWSSTGRERGGEIRTSREEHKGPSHLHYKQRNSSTAGLTTGVWSTRTDARTHVLYH